MKGDKKLFFILKPLRIYILSGFYVAGVEGLLFCGKVGSWLFRATGTKFTTTRFESFLFPNQKTTLIGWFFALAGVEGLEPSRTVLETGMLPLHYAPIKLIKMVGL